MLTRRRFLSFLGAGAAAAAVPAVLVPKRRIWQVPRSAPVGARRWFVREDDPRFHHMDQEPLRGRCDGWSIDEAGFARGLVEIPIQDTRTGEQMSYGELYRRLLAERHGLDANAEPQWTERIDVRADAAMRSDQALMLAEPFRPSQRVLLTNILSGSEIAPRGDRQRS